MSPPTQTNSYVGSRMLNNITQIGVGMGLMFPLMAIVIDLLYHDYALTTSNIALLFRQNPLHWVILSAPVVLGGTCYWLGIRIDARERFLQERAAAERRQAAFIESYVSALAKGDLNVEVSADLENSALASILNSFRDNLVKERTAADQRRWTNEGLTQFGDLLRKHADLNELSFAVASNLAKYLQCMQSGLFTHESDEEGEFLQLRGFYAYTRKKYLQKRIDIGTGLLGQCYLEKRTILLYDVPQDYVTITSGLGEANPDCLVICPLKTEDTVVGVVELASFRRLAPYEVSFLEKVCENTASVFKNLRSNEETRRLLAASREQTEMMQSQEEEMRQNLEELSATQEEMLRKEKEFTGLIEAYRRQYGDVVTQGIGGTE